jgi:hypothetical protein
LIPFVGPLGTSDDLLGLLQGGAGDADLVVVVEEGLQGPPGLGFGDEFDGDFVEEVAVFDAADPGADGLLDGAGGVGVGQDVGAPLQPTRRRPPKASNSPNSPAGSPP